MDNRPCPNCGGNLGRRTVKVEMKVGKRLVDDNSARALACDACDYYELSQKQLEEMERKAAIVALSDAKEISGEELKFARKAVGLRQTDFARALDVEPETVSRWEKDRAPIDRQTALAAAQLLTLHKTNKEQFALLTGVAIDDVDPPAASTLKRRVG